MSTPQLCKLNNREATITSKSNEPKETLKETWVRKVYKERKLKGEFHLLIKEMKLHDALVLRKEIPFAQMKN